MEHTVLYSSVLYCSLLRTVLLRTYVPNLSLIYGIILGYRYSSYGLARATSSGVDIRRANLHFKTTTALGPTNGAPVVLPNLRACLDVARREVMLQDVCMTRLEI